MAAGVGEVGLEVLEYKAKWRQQMTVNPCECQRFK